MSTTKEIPWKPLGKNRLLGGWRRRTPGGVRTELDSTARLIRTGVLTAAASHEVKNLIFALKAQAEVGLLSDEPGAERRALKRVLEAADDMGRYFNALVDFARGEDGGEGTMDPAAAVERTVALLAPVFRKSGVSVDQDVFPVGRIRGSESTLRQVLFNLLLNANAAMTDGGGTITVVVRPLPDAVEIRVRDTGPGLPPAVREHLYEPFASGSGSTAGLGLFVARRMVRRLGGGIDVESSPLVGTVFILTLPVNTRFW